MAIPLIGGAPHQNRPWSAGRFSLYTDGVIHALRELSRLPVSDSFSVERLAFVSSLAPEIALLKQEIDAKLWA